MVWSKNHWEGGHHIRGLDGKRIKSEKQGKDGGPFTAGIEFFDESQTSSHP